MDEPSKTNTYRILRLNQFLNIYTNIKQQYDAINMYQPTMNENSDTPVGIAQACCSLKESKLFDT
jgi:hypothetical protein